MDDHPSNFQEGYEFADDMLQLLGGDPGQLTLPQSMVSQPTENLYSQLEYCIIVTFSSLLQDFSALPHLQTLTQQPSLGKVH